LCRNEEWLKAFDCFKVALKLERSLEENSANTALTCAVILSKLDRYGESIDYAQACMEHTESALGIDRKRPLAEYKMLGTDPQRRSDYDKKVTTYAIALHLLGKNLANLKFMKEAKVFLNRANYVSLSLMLKQKPDLQLAITNDLNVVSVITSFHFFY